MIEDIVFKFEDKANIDHAPIHVASDSYRDNNNNKQSKSTARDPTPAPKPPSQPTCKSCNELLKVIEKLKSEQVSENVGLKKHIQEFQTVFLKIKNYLNLAGQFDFTPSSSNQ